jgi:hypothetical protein
MTGGGSAGARVISRIEMNDALISIVAAGASRPLSAGRYGLLPPANGVRNLLLNP